MRTMNRRTFLHLFTATAAAAVAGLRPRPEPTEVVTRLGRGSRDTLDNFGIPAEDFKLAVHKFTDTVWVGGLGAGDPVLREIEAYIETELCDEMRAIALEIDREFMEGAGTGAVLGVL